MISVEQALGAVLERIDRLDAEMVSAASSLGSVLAADIVSKVDISPFDNSGMDGYALRAEDIAGACPDSPVVLRVVDHIAAGSNPIVGVFAGQAARIMTGAPVPSGADTVVMVEKSRALENDGGIGGTVAFDAPAPLGEFVRLRGEDVMTGDVVLSAGEVVGPAAVGLMASVGVTEVSVYRRPRVAIVATGDELVDASETPGPGQIRNSNGPALEALVAAAGGVPCFLGVARDNEADTEAILSRASEFDLMVSTGGVSMGDFDVVRGVLDRIGVMDYWKIAMKPGAPQTYGTIGGTPFFGLPGNPTSTMVGFELFVRPAIRKLRGFASLYRPSVPAVLSHDVHKQVGRRHYLRGVIERIDSGDEPHLAYSARVSGRQSSAMLTPLHRANCLISIPADVAEMPAGSVVQCLRLDMEEGTP